MAVDENVLKELAGCFPPEAPLFAVGGFCRDKLLGVTPRDVDVCAKLALDDIRTLLKNTDFVISDRCLRLGTAVISKDGFSAEYTRFRTDSYPEGKGDHRPDGVKFTDDMRADARRRDFACNAVYLNVRTGEYADFSDGKGDIRRKVLRAADNPEKVFGEDGLRVLRLARFHAELGFGVDEETFAAAKRNAWRVKDITRERVFAELDKIIVADTAYPELGVKDGHVRGLEMLDRLGLLPLLLPELDALKGLQQSPKHHVFDAYRHSVVAYEVSAPDIRWAALLHDIGKRPTMERQGNMYGHDAVGAEMTKVRLAALGMPKTRAERTAKLIACHMADLKEDTSENKLRLYIVDHADVMEQLVELKRADGYATKGRPVPEARIGRLWREMLHDGTPFAVTDLPVGGDDAAAVGLAGVEIGRALDDLRREAVVNPLLRERDRAREFLARRAQKVLSAREGGEDAHRRKK